MYLSKQLLAKKARDSNSFLLGSMTHLHLFLHLQMISNILADSRDKGLRLLLITKIKTLLFREEFVSLHQEVHMDL